MGNHPGVTLSQEERERVEAALVKSRKIEVFTAASGVARATVYRALRGEPIQRTTVRALLAACDKSEGLGPRDALVRSLRARIEELEAEVAKLRGVPRG